MKAIDADVVPGWTPAAPAAGQRGGLPAWIASPPVAPWVFAAKTTASGLLALLIAFTFDLDQPKWALLTVFIVAQPESGLVLAKSFHRIIGTLIGAAGALLLVSLFAQEQVLFLGALSAWIGLCTFASKKARNFAAYGFALAGYTVAIVGIPGALNPGNAFFIAIDRVTEISLGIICTAAINRLVLPLSIAQSMFRAMADGTAQLCDYVAAVAEGSDTALLRASLLRQVMAIERQRTSAAFEDHDIRLRSEALRGLGISAITVIGVASQLDQSLRWMRSGGAGTDPDVDEAIKKAISDIKLWREGRIDSAALRQAFDHARANLPLARDRRRGEAVPDDDLALTAATIARVEDLLDAFADFADAYDACRSPRPAARPAAFSRSNDSIDAAWAGLRAALAVVIVSAFWILADWPSGPTAVILATVMTTRLATMEDAMRTAMASALIAIVAATPAFVVIEIALPKAAGFIMFSLATAPMLFAGAYLMAHKKTYGVGFVAGLYFASVGEFHDRMVYDPIAFINTTIAIVIAFAAAAVLFAVVAPDTADAARRSFVRAARSAFARVPQQIGPVLPDIGRPAFETAFAEALDRLCQRVPADRADNIATIESGLALIGLGRELIQVRDRGKPAVLEARRSVFEFVARGGEREYSRSRDAVRNAADACLAELRNDVTTPTDARMAGRSLAAFLAIESDLERSCRLLLGATTTLVPAHAV